MRSVVHLTLALCVVVAARYPTARPAPAGEPHAATAQAALHVPVASTATPRRPDSATAPHDWAFAATPAPVPPPRTAFEIVHGQRAASTASELATATARGPPGN
jgi:hypothetical protein